VNQYRIYFTQIAAEMIESVKDKRVQKLLCERIQKLCIEPEKQGKELSGKLSGYRSVRAVGQRYRIIYRIEGMSIVIVGVGLRKDRDLSDIYHRIGDAGLNDF